MHTTVGTEWVIDAWGCDPARLCDGEAIARLFDRVVAELGLTPVGEPRFHVFPGPGGVSGLVMLTESHLACHTYPEHGIATFNLYCCRARPDWPWAERLAEALGAAGVSVRALERGGDAREGAAAC